MWGFKMPDQMFQFEVISSRQIRAARALIGWEQADLAQAAGVSKSSIQRAENGSDPRASTIAAIERAFDQAGLIFLDVDDTRGSGVGIRMKSGRPPREGGR